jgi:hypothetical protein
MKFIKAAIPGLIITVAFFCWVGLSSVDSADLWPNKHGELCWKVYPPSSPFDPTMVKLAVVRTFNDHYLVHGTVTETEGSTEYVRCINGNAEIVNGKVIMHGSTAVLYPNGHLIGGLGLVELNLSTLNGWSEGINIWYDTSSGPGNTGEVKYDGIALWELIDCN